MPEGTLHRHKNENWKQWNARRRASELLPKNSVIPIPPIGTPGLTLSGRPFNEPQTPAPEEFPNREYVEGTFLGRGATNPRIIFVGLPGRNDRISVFVKDASNFVLGMKVRAFRDCSNGLASAWYLNSPLPRFRGRY
jgi:hypothetical protein